MRKRKRHTLVMVAWFALVIGAGAALLAGVTEPYLSTAQLPGEELSVFVGIIGGLLVGGVVSNRLGRRAWTAAGTGAGLEPQGGGLLGGRPDFSGTVRGRPVEVWIYEESTGAQETKETHRYVVFEAELTSPIEEGFAIVPDGGDGSGGVNVLPESTLPADPTFEAVGPGADRYADAVLSGESLSALAALHSFGSFAVGDAADAVMDAMPASARAMLEGVPGTDASEELEREGQSDAATASHTVEGLILESEEFERQVEAVLAVADAVESASASSA